MGYLSFCTGQRLSVRVTILLFLIKAYAIMIPKSDRDVNVNRLSEIQICGHISYGHSICPINFRIVLK